MHTFFKNLFRTYNDNDVDLVGERMHRWSLLKGSNKVVSAGYGFHYICTESGIWGDSSRGAERRTVNPMVVGSNPSLPASPSRWWDV